MRNALPRVAGRPGQVGANLLRAEEIVDGSAPRRSGGRRRSVRSHEPMRLAAKGRDA